MKISEGGKNVVKERENHENALLKLKGLVVELVSAMVPVSHFIRL